MAFLLTYHQHAAQKHPVEGRLKELIEQPSNVLGHMDARHGPSGKPFCSACRHPTRLSSSTGRTTCCEAVTAAVRRRPHISRWWRTLPIWSVSQRHDRSRRALPAVLAVYFRAQDWKQNDAV